VASFVRKVPTASGARAVQIVHKRGRDVVGIEHVGSAHDEARLALLMEIARQRLYPEQEVLDLEAGGRDGVGVGARITATRSRILWEVLTAAYARLGFDALGDVAFRAMVMARIVEPTSKADTVRVLEEIGAPCPSLRTLFRALQRCQARDYRGRLAVACMAHSARTSGRAGLVLYDCTTLHFENEDEDELRRVGMSKEHRVDPQVQVGLLVDPVGFPLEVHLFEGNAAETKTLVPVLASFQARHGVADMVVVADAGMLSASNLNAIEDAGYSFIVGSRLAKAPYDLADHFERHGNYFTDGQILESARVMGNGPAGRRRRVVYQWSFKRNKRDDRTINAMIAKAEKIATGQAPLKKARFLKVSGAVAELDQATIERARQLAGLKGYVTNLSPDTMSGQAVIAAYHDLWQVEASFRMTKSDLKARPVFHHQREAIEAHLSVVFAALAVARHLQDTTGVTIKKLVRALRPLHTVTIDIAGHELTAETTPSADAAEILAKLPSTG
jgi:Transposase DDE domain